MNAPLQIQPVVMAGGSGTRLWPLSRAQHPKQFLVLTGNRSLFQDAATRLAGLAGGAQLGAGPPQAQLLPPRGAGAVCGDRGPTCEIQVLPPCVVGNEEHRFLVLEQLREVRLDPSAVILEPQGRNTAPAVTLAALQAQEGGADPVLVIAPSDHTIADLPAFTQALRQAASLAAQGAIVTVGIKPDRPETGYGYLRCEGASGAQAARVLQFVEKPDAATAEKYLADGRYSWNGGMFVLKASVWLAALDKFRPDIAAATRASWAARSVDAKFVRPGAAEFAAVPAESVDYAVMERCPGSAFDLRMVPLSAGWSDLGAWDAVWQVSPQDAQGNVTVGDTLLQDARNTLVHATSRLVSVVGLDGVIVVETADAVLVTDRAHSQDVKKVVVQLGAQQRGEKNLHRKVHRPWGWYDSIDAGARFQVKRIMVKPGATLSLQMHHHRAEHWIVVSGTAEVTCGDKKLLLTENQSTYIPLGETHRLANPGKVPLELIEVQSGSYLGEDDIVRFEDTYGRAR
jgi:mannose-1-phosphate guanylyltransferase/mannose-6-phosphate isomerase